MGDEEVTFTPDEILANGGTAQDLIDYGFDPQDYGFDYTGADAPLLSGADYSWGNMAFQPEDIAFIQDAITSGQLTAADLATLGITPQQMSILGLPDSIISGLYDNEIMPDTGPTASSALVSALGGNIDSTGKLTKDMTIGGQTIPAGSTISINPTTGQPSYSAPGWGQTSLPLNMSLPSSGGGSIFSGLFGGSTGGTAGGMTGGTSGTGGIPWGSIIPALAGIGTAIGGGVTAANAASNNADAIRGAANISAASSDKSLALYEKMYNDAIKRNEPYSNLGLTGIKGIETGQLPAGLAGMDQTKLPLTYDEVVANYDVNNPAYAELQRQRREATNEQLSARGMLRGAVGANLLADQERKLAAEEFDKKRAADQQRYSGLISDYNLRKSQTQDSYNKLLDLVKIGQGAAGTAGNYGQNYATNVANVNTANAANASNAAIAGAANENAGTSNIFNAITGGAGLGLKAYSTFNPPQNYWGNPWGGTN